MDYNEAKAAIRSAALHFGREVTRDELARQFPAHEPTIRANNIMNDEVISRRVIAGLPVEIAIVDFRGMRNGSISCGITVFGRHDLTDCIPIDCVSAHLETIKESGQ